MQLAKIGTLKRLAGTAVMRMRLWKYLVIANVVALATTKKEMTQLSGIYRSPCNVVQRGWLERENTLVMFTIFNEITCFLGDGVRVSSL